MMFKRGVILLACVCCGLTLSGAGVFAQKIEDRAREHYNKGNEFYTQGKYLEAQAEYELAMELLRAKSARQPSDAVSPGVSEPVMAAPVSAGAKRALPEYTVTIDDEMKISVWQNPDLDHEVTVRSDGRISFPLIGDIVAEGLTVSQLTNQIQDKLQEFVRNPKVSILLKKMGGSRVVIIGEVNKPGIYNVTRARTVFEAIALAEGTTNHAVLSSVVLVRNVLTNPTAQRINLAKIMQGKDLQQNMVLQSEDLIFVPKRFIANLNYFLGQIVDPIAKGAFVHRELEDW
ncbi:MAG TPA: polysaccharide biosynthesis/export family protein [Candidatus Omnitrophota bacterium]|nr:polysaccharide biosynthesis/export family protein [Candidatus Omnitrophota bacterium]HRZ14515.1 polysaccharide biosynthesis/export family protein [Candidatus Omnitrophota bacterium]